MKTCNCFGDLRQFGITFLTGESDALMFRILCDLDEQGIKVFKELHGMEVPPVGFHQYEHYLKLGLNDGWNNGLASVLLTNSDIVPLSIIGFYLQGYDVVVARDEHNHQHVYALESNERVELNEKGDDYNFIQVLPYPVKENSSDHVVPWPKSYGRIVKITRQQESDGKVVQGTRNVHQFTGRVH